MSYQRKRVGEVQDDRVKFEISTIAFREVMFRFIIVCLADCENLNLYSECARGGTRESTFESI